ncbi:unnamed protein product [Dicrocoelium dendriticum]|nr:unnamed protein product [Dicrocoelium dendriticum]
MNFVPLVEGAVVGPPDWFLSSVLSANKWLHVDGGGYVLLAFSSKPFVHIFTINFESLEVLERRNICYIGQLKAHHERICGVSFCDSGSFDLICVNLFTCGNDGLVRLWRYVNLEWILEDEYNLWSITNTWCCASVKVPGNPRSAAKESERLGDSKKQSIGAPWISATWLPTSDAAVTPNIYLSGLRGELYAWSGSGQPIRLNVGDFGHSTLVFAMVRVNSSPGFLFTVGQDRQVMLWRQSEGDTLSHVLRIPTISAGVFAISQSNHGLGPVAAGVADGSITLWRHGYIVSSRSESQSVDDIVSFYPRGLNATSITTLAWHPSARHESLLAYGTEAGCVDIVDIAKVSKSSTQKGKSQPYVMGSTVYRVVWGPLLFGNLCNKGDFSTLPVDVAKEQTDESSLSTNCSNSRTDKFQFYVYSVCKGKFFLHVGFQRPPQDVTALFPEPPDVSQDDWLGDKRSDISFLFLDEGRSNLLSDSTTTQLHTTFDCLVAVGLRSGLVYLYGHTSPTDEVLREGSPNLQLICKLSSHTKGINCMAWSPLYYWLAVGSNEYFITVTDLSDTLRQVVKCKSPHLYHLTTSLAHLEGHCNRVTCLDWSPHDPHLLLSASYDGTANVWRIDHKEDAVSLANFRAHRLRLFACLWSRRDIDLAFTGGESCHLFSWRPSRLEEKAPPNIRRLRPPPLKRLPVDAKSLPVPESDIKETVTGPCIIDEVSNASPSPSIEMEPASTSSTTEPKPLQSKKQTTSTERRKRPSLFPNFLRRDSASHSSVCLDFIPPFQLGSRFMQVLHVLYWLHSKVPPPDVDRDLLFLLPHCMQTRHLTTRFLTDEADLHFNAYKLAQRPNSLNHLDAYCMIQLWLGRAPLVANVLCAESHMPFWLLWAVQLALSTSSTFGTCWGDADLLEAKVKEISLNGSDILLASTLLVCGGRSSAAIDYLLKHDRVKEALILSQIRLNPTDANPVIKQCLMRIAERRLVSDVPFLNVIHALGEGQMKEAHSLLRRTNTGSGLHAGADPEQLASNWVEVNVILASDDTSAVVNAFARLAYTCMLVGFNLTIDQWVHYFHQWQASSIPVDPTGLGSACFKYLLKTGFYISEVLNGCLDSARAENLLNDTAPLLDTTRAFRWLAEDRQPSTQWATCVAHLVVDFALCLVLSTQTDIADESSDEDFRRFSCSLHRCADVRTKETIQLIGGVLLTLSNTSKNYEKLCQALSSPLSSFGQSSA